jgi:hypothetical protein
VGGDVGIDALCGWLLAQPETRTTTIRATNPLDLELNNMALALRFISFHRAAGSTGAFDNHNQ